MTTVAVGLDRTSVELKMYSREKEAVFFSFSSRSSCCSCSRSSSRASSRTRHAPG